MVFGQPQLPVTLIRGDVEPQDRTPLSMNDAVGSGIEEKNIIVKYCCTGRRPWVN